MGSDPIKEVQELSTNAPLCHGDRDELRELCTTIREENTTLKIHNNIIYVCIYLLRTDKMASS